MKSLSYEPVHADADNDNTVTHLSEFRKICTMHGDSLAALSIPDFYFRVTEHFVRKL